MKFKAIAKANIKTDDGWILVMPNDIVDLPIKYTRHPALEKVEEKPTLEEKVEKPSKVENKLFQKLEEKIEEIRDDLADDGKLNYSNNPKKKSPGRPKKSKQK